MRFRNIKKALTSVMAYVLALNIGLCTNVYAATENSAENVVNYEVSDVNLNGSNQTDIRASRGSSYFVTIPKLITLDGINKNCTYNVRVGGDIAGCETVYVIPDESFTLHEAGGKADAAATVEQDKISWTFADVWANDGQGTMAEGLVSAPITAGNWTGYFFFNLRLDKEDTTQSVDHDIPITEDENASVLLRLIDDAEEVELSDPTTLSTSFSQNGYTATINEISYVDSTEDTEGSYTYTVTLSKLGVQTYTSRQYTRKIPKKGHVHTEECYCGGRYAKFVETVTKKCKDCDGTGSIATTIIGHRHTDECYGNNVIKSNSATYSVAGTKYSSYTKYMDVLDLSGLPAGTIVTVNVQTSIRAQGLPDLLVHLHGEAFFYAWLDGYVSAPEMISNNNAPALDGGHITADGLMPSRIENKLVYNRSQASGYAVVPDAWEADRSNHRQESYIRFFNGSNTSEQFFDGTFTFTILKNMPDNYALTAYGKSGQNYTYTITAKAYTKEVTCGIPTTDSVEYATCTVCDGTGVDPYDIVDYWTCDICGVGRKSDEYYGTLCNRKICGKD